eukprot:TRINITY_DN10594_c0_g1_i1.p1 TRINITY_DN10594_c0_g1~~TRINITY_DN10594_c0_g1_i1.p1  ORF type:complete len:559 (+),score=155.88 TRINITY_DN10594_c0_g1_i1:149-1825(+)
MEDSAAALAEWLRSERGVDVSQFPVRIAEFSATGRGLQAVRRIDKDETVLRVPFECFVSEYTALSGPSGAAMRRARRYLCSELRLCLHLIGERALGSESGIAAYIRSLPEGCRSLDSAPDSHVALLQHPVRLGKVRRRRAKIAALYQRLRGLVERNPDLLPPGVGPDAVTAGSFLWAYNVVDARAFSISLGKQHPREVARAGGRPSLPDPMESASEDSGSESDASERTPSTGGTDDWVLVPFADMLNHAHDGICNYGFEPAEDGGAGVGDMVFRASRAVDAGEQVFLRYNEGMGAFQFAKHYGFTPQEGTVRRDRFPLATSIEPVRRLFPTMLERAKDRVFRDFNLTNKKQSVIRQGAEGAEPSETLMAALRVRGLQAEEFAEGVRRAAVLKRAVSASNELNAYAHLQKMLRDALSAYDTTIKQDTAALEAADIPHTARLCLTVRRADKSLLASALYVAQQRHKELAESIYTGDASATEDLLHRRESMLRRQAAAVSARIGAGPAASAHSDDEHAEEEAPEWVTAAAKNLGRLLDEFAARGRCHADAASFEDLQQRVS